MVDLFEVNRFLQFYMHEYPEMKLHFKLDPVTYNAEFSIQVNKWEEYGFYNLTHCFYTNGVINRLNAILIDFLAKEKCKGVF